MLLRVSCCITRFVSSWDTCQKSRSAFVRPLVCSFVRAGFLGATDAIIMYIFCHFCINSWLFYIQLSRVVFYCRHFLVRYFVFNWAETSFIVAAFLVRDSIFNETASSFSVATFLVRYSIQYSIKQNRHLLSPLFSSLLYICLLYTSDAADE